MRHQLPSPATVHVDPQVSGVLHGVWPSSRPNDVTIGPGHHSTVSEDPDLVLFYLEQVEGELSLCDTFQELGLRAESTV
jgi:hypothetical protein